MTYVKTYLPTLKTHVANLKRDAKDLSRDLQGLEVRGKLGSKTLYWLVFTRRFLLFCHSTWSTTDKSKAVIGGVTLARTPTRKWELNSNWLTAGKECGSILSGRLWGAALRDNTKKGCVADSTAGSRGEISWMTFYKFQLRIASFKWRWFYCERFV